MNEGTSTKTWSLMQSHWVHFSIEILPRIKGQHYTIQLKSRLLTVQCTTRTYANGEGGWIPACTTFRALTCKKRGSSGSS